MGGHAPLSPLGCAADVEYGQYSNVSLVLHTVYKTREVSEFLIVRSDNFKPIKLIIFNTKYVMQNHGLNRFMKIVKSVYSVREFVRKLDLTILAMPAIDSCMSFCHGL